MRHWQTTGSFASVAVCGLLWALPGQPTAEYPLDPGTLYAARVDAQVTRLDVPFTDPGEQYLIVVSNLSSDPAPVAVHLGAQPIDAVELVPLLKVPPLRSRAKRAKVKPRATRATKVARRMRCFYLPISESASENPRAYRRIDGLLKGEGRHVRVYVDRDDRVTSRAVDWITAEFDHSVWPNTVRRLGTPRDVDGDGKFAILLTERLARLDNGRVSLGGLVRNNDFRPETPWPFSNAADVLYLNAGVRPGAHLETLMAHELAHAATISGRLDAAWWPRSARDEENWLNEAIAHVAENLQSDNWSNLDYRVDRFLSSPANAPLVVASYQQYGLWRDPGVRGSCYLFLRWCVDHYGSAILPKLVHSTARGTANLERATGQPFAELYRRYAADLFLQTAGVGHEDRTAGDDEIPRLDLAQPLGRWGLAGPRFALWDAGSSNREELTANLHGTTTQYFVMASSAEGPRRITIHAEPGARLQVSLARLPPRMARLALNVRPTPTGGLRLRLRELSGTEVQLTHVVWQTTTPGPRPRHRLIRHRQLSQLFNQTHVPAGGVLTSRPLRRDELPRGSLSFRVAGVDAAGFRVAAWADFDGKRSPATLAMAR